MIVKRHSGAFHGSYWPATGQPALQFTGFFLLTLFFFVVVYLFIIGFFFALYPVPYG